MRRSPPGQDTTELEHVLLDLTATLDAAMCSLETFEEETRPRLEENTRSILASFARLREAGARTELLIPRELIREVKKLPGWRDWPNERESGMAVPILEKNSETLTRFDLCGRDVEISISD
jgi:hypothetical protein